MRDQPALFSIWPAIKKVEHIMIAIAGRVVLAVGIALTALVVLVLLILPGGLEVLAIEWERAKRWMRPTCGFLIGKPAPFQAIGSAPSLAIRHNRRKLWGGAFFT